MNRLQGILLLALSCLFAAPALADAPPNYLGVFGSYVLPDSGRNDDPGPGWHGIYGSPVNRWLGVELNLFGAELPHDYDSVSDYIYGGGIDLRFYGGGPRFGGFVLTGIGAYYDDLVNEEETSPYVDVGGGVQLALSPLFALRADARYYAIFNSETVPGESIIYDARFNLGLLFQFESDRPPMLTPLDSDGDGVLDDADRCPGTPRGQPVDATGCPADEDGDGVPNDKDQCPGTPPGTLVDARGCPAPVPTAPVIGDSDGDGVSDDGDRCPDTPRGAVVDLWGCPIDSDGDGVLNSADLCPDTLPGLRVDDRGCVLQDQSIVLLRSVNFEFDSARLTGDARRILDGAVLALRGQPTMEVELAGHTDALGSQTYNLRLSQDRAAAVRRFLIERGISESRMKSEGYGEFNPIADNETEEGRALNRRVEFKVVKQ